MLSPAVLVVPYISILINLFMHEHVKSEKICPGWIGEFEDSTEPNSCRDDVSTCSCKDNENMVEIQFYEETRVWVRCHFDTASIKWYGIPKENIDVLQNYSTIEIEDCSIPEESIKDILPQLKVEKVEELNIHSIYDRNNETYRNMHFKNLDFVKNICLLRGVILHLYRKTYLMDCGMYYFSISNIINWNTYREEFSKI